MEVRARAISSSPVVVSLKREDVVSHVCLGSSGRSHTGQHCLSTQPKNIVQHLPNESRSSNKAFRPSNMEADHVERRQQAQGSLVHEVDDIRLEIEPAEQNVREECTVTSANGEDSTKLKVVLRLENASCLRNANFLGKSDPYVRLCLFQGERLFSEMRSSIRRSTLDPVWHEEYEMDDFEAATSLLLEVWDKDLFAKDQFLGEAWLDAQQVLQALGTDESESKQELALESNEDKSNLPSTGILSVSFRLGHAVSCLWKKPDLALAREHRRKARPYNPASGKPYPFRSAVLTDEQLLGEGIALYLRFLRHMGAVLLLMFLLALPSLLLYAHGSALPPDVHRGQGLLALPTLGNWFASSQPAASSQHTATNTATVEINVFGSTRQLDRRLVATLFPALDLVATLVFLSYLWWDRRTTEKGAEGGEPPAPARVLTCSDYSVMVSGIRGRGVGRAELLEYVQARFGRVASLTVATSREVFLRQNKWVTDVTQRLDELEARVALHQQRARERSEPLPLFWVHDPHAEDPAPTALATRKTVHMPLIFELDRQRRRLQALQAKLLACSPADDAAFVAFVVFRSAASKAACLAGQGGWAPYLCTQREGDARFHAIRFANAPEPSNVAWENLEYGSTQRGIRACAIACAVFVLLLASFGGILQAQLYRRSHPLPACPPPLLDSPRDTRSARYFSNALDAAWGPGDRGVGLSPLFKFQGQYAAGDAGPGATGPAFDLVSVCVGGPLSGSQCATPADCTDSGPDSGSGQVESGGPGDASRLAPVDSGECVEIDLSCSYRDDLAALELSGRGASDKGRILDEGFVVHGTEGNQSALRWDKFGLPPFCDADARVFTPKRHPDAIQTAHSPLLSLSVEALSQLQIFPGGVTANESCANLSLGNATCAPAPAECAQYPGCSRPSLPPCLHAELRRCVVQVAPYGANSTPAAANGSVAGPWRDWTAADDVSACMPGGGGQQPQCAFRFAAEYSTGLVEYEGVPVRSEWVCARYREGCESCFCLDTVAEFWFVWLLSYSAGYTDLCSPRFRDMAQQASLFAVAAASVVIVNLALRTILRKLAGFEKRHTLSNKERSITVKVFLAQLCNTALVPLLVYARVEALSASSCRGGTGTWDPNRPEETFGFNGMPCAPADEAEGRAVCSYGGGECRGAMPDFFPIFGGEFGDFSRFWYSTVASGITVTVSVTMLLTLVPVAVTWPLQQAQEWLAPAVAVNQRQLNRLLEGPSFELASRYGVLLSSVFACLLFAAGAPALYLVAALTCSLFSLLADKCTLLRLYKTPPRYDARFARLAQRLLPLAALLHLPFAAWQFSALLPVVPVSPALAAFLHASRDAACLAAANNAPARCTWQCKGPSGSVVSCGRVVNGTELVIDGTLCEGGDAACHAAPDWVTAVTLRLLSWSALPHLAVFVLLLLSRLLLSPRSCRAVSSVLGSLSLSQPCGVGNGGGDVAVQPAASDPIPPYPVAVANATTVHPANDNNDNDNDAENDVDDGSNHDHRGRPPQRGSAQSQRCGGQAGDVWRGPFNYDLAQLPRYQEALTDAALAGVSKLTWDSDEAKRAVAVARGEASKEEREEWDARSGRSSVGSGGRRRWVGRVASWDPRVSLERSVTSSPSVDWEGDGEGGRQAGANAALCLVRGGCGEERGWRGEGRDMVVDAGAKDIGGGVRGSGGLVLGAGRYVVVPGSDSMDSGGGAEEQEEQEGAGAREGEEEWRVVVGEGGGEEAGGQEPEAVRVREDEPGEGADDYETETEEEEAKEGRSVPVVGGAVQVADGESDAAYDAGTDEDSFGGDPRTVLAQP